MISKRSNSHQHMRWIPDPPREFIHTSFDWEVHPSDEGKFSFRSENNQARRYRPNILFKGQVYGTVNP